MLKTKYYVYKHIRLDSATTFYVGKGTNDRMFHKNRNGYWNNIVAKHGYTIKIIKYFSNEAKAYEYESRLIKLYKKYNRGEANLTNGGEGFSTDQVSGKLNHQFLGYLVTPKGIFETSGKAAVANNCSGSTICNRIKNIEYPEYYLQDNILPKLKYTKDEICKFIQKRKQNSKKKRQIRISKRVYYTPYGKFITSDEAGKENNISGKALIRRCKNNEFNEYYFKVKD